MTILIYMPACALPIAGRVLHFFVQNWWTVLLNLTNSLHCLHGLVQCLLSLFVLVGSIALEAFQL